MNLRKGAIMFVLTALAMLLCGVALADGVINPHHQAAQPPAQRSECDKAVGITITCTQQPTLEQEGIWQLVGSGVNRYCVYVLDKDWDTCFYTGWTTETTFRYQFVTAGRYIIYVQAAGAGGSGYKTADVTVADDDAHPTLEERVSELATLCLQAGCSSDFEKALWMHDWLTQNARYDRTYSYYSADGVLIRGSGTCDSYRKAYEMLLRAVGVECTYVTGGNHAWNQVKMDGEWYNVDVTWDDPIAVNNTTVTGYESHMYFGLPDELMEYDHTFATHPHICTAYDDNYYVYTGETKMWTDPLLDRIHTQLQGQKAFFNIDLPQWYMTDGGYYSYGKEFVVYNLAGYAMSRMDFLSGDRILHVNASYPGRNSRTMAVEVRFDGYTLSLPAALGMVPDEMFAGNTAAMAAVVPEGATSIGAGAFSGCSGLWRADIPDSVTSIGANAFRDCPRLVIVCGRNSAAHAYAQRSGIDFVIRAQ